MKSTLIYKHIKNNTLRYTVALSAGVHLIGILFFPSWGTIPEVVTERIIKIKTVIQQPEKPVKKKLSKPKKQPEPTIPKKQKKTPRVKSTEVRRPSSVMKHISSPIDHSAQLFKPMKAVQRKFTTPYPRAKTQKLSIIELPPALPTKVRQENAKKTLARPSRVLARRQASVSFLKTQQADTQNPIRRVTTQEISSPNTTIQRKQFPRMVLAAPLSPSQTNFSFFSPASVVKGKTGNKFNKLFSVHPRTIQQLNKENSTSPALMENLTPMFASASSLEIQPRSPKSFESKISSTVQRAATVPKKNIASPLSTASLMQMASIPLEFVGKPFNSNGETEDSTLAWNGFAEEKNELSADLLGKIKLAFSSKIRTKIARTKYYPRTARRRGFEGEPVVAFTLGNTGELLEVSINNPSQHKLLDEAALDAVRSASPYPPIPELLQVKTLRFKLPISFILEGP